MFGDCQECLNVYIVLERVVTRGKFAVESIVKNLGFFVNRFEVAVKSVIRCETRSDFAK